MSAWKESVPWLWQGLSHAGAGSDPGVGPQFMEVKTCEGCPLPEESCDAASAGRVSLTTVTKHRMYWEVSLACHAWDLHKDNKKALWETNEEGLCISPEYGAWDAC